MASLFLSLFLFSVSIGVANGMGQLTLTGGQSWSDPNQGNQYGQLHIVGGQYGQRQQPAVPVHTGTGQLGQGQQLTAPRQPAQPGTGQLGQGQQLTAPRQPVQPGTGQLGQGQQLTVPRQPFQTGAGQFGQGQQLTVPRQPVQTSMGYYDQASNRMVSQFDQTKQMVDQAGGQSRQSNQMREQYGQAYQVGQYSQASRQYAQGRQTSQISGQQPPLSTGQLTTGQTSAFGVNQMGFQRAPLGQSQSMTSGQQIGPTAGAQLQCSVQAMCPQQAVMASTGRSGGQGCICGCYSYTIDNSKNKMPVQGTIHYRLTDTKRGEVSPGVGRYYAGPGTIMSRTCKRVCQWRTYGPSDAGPVTVTASMQMTGGVSGYGSDTCMFNVQRQPAVFNMWKRK